jgi:hypothetical protein
MGKEIHLNNTLNRWHLNSKAKVGDLIDQISIAMPLSVEEWEDYYYRNVRTEDALNDIGNTIFEKLHTIVKDEIDSITREELH